MSRHLDPNPPGKRRTAAAAAFAIAGLAITGAGVYAALSATAFNTSPETVTSGTLKLEMSANGDGFTQSVSNLAPGDVVNRYVDLSNDGTLAAKDINLAVADSGSSLLSTDASKGLHVTIVQCSGGTFTPSTGACSGATSTLVNNMALSNMVSAPQSVVSGAVAVGATYHFKVSLTLPDQNETTTNGTLPVGTIQGLTANLTWTFSESQRTATTTNS
jgi:spore coat-associated protein N